MKTRFLKTLLCSALFVSPLLSANEPTGPVIELEAFEVFSRSITVIDGMTGQEYRGKHPVILQFRRSVNDTLIKVHKRLLVSEYQKVTTRIKNLPEQIKEIEALTESFGLKGFKPEGPFLIRERVMLQRMMKDPYFSLKRIVVWDLGALQLGNKQLPNNEFADNIRFNEEKNVWERRVLTKWEVLFARRNHRGEYDNYHNFKIQGLNLDTNEGFHFVDRGLIAEITPESFKDVELDYPIFIDYSMDADEQLKKLERDLIGNLFYLYDPFSWAARGNTRFNLDMKKQILPVVKRGKWKLEEREWFDEILARLISDVAYIKQVDTNLIYEYQILRRISKNKNMIGTDLDLLNWNKKEKRSIDYDPDRKLTIPGIGFPDRGHAGQTRFILIDAYRRYGDKFLDALRQRLEVAEPGTNARDLVRGALEDASGLPADKYIPAAAKAQRQILQQFADKYQPGAE